MKSLENKPLGKRSQNSDIQVAKIGIKSKNKGLITRRKGVKKDKNARYRKIHVYTKSLERYKLERERRRQVQLLAEKGLGQKGIARELGVSTRTVKRDWKKLSRYIKGQFNRQVWEINARQLEKERQRYEGLTIKEELKLIKKDLKALKKRHLL